MIENLQDELDQLENKQGKGAKLRANIRSELKGEICSKLFFQVLERQNLQNQIISELYTDGNKSKYSSNPKDIFKNTKKICWLTTSKAATTEFFTKIPNRKKIFNEQFNLCETKVSLDEIIKSIKSQTNESPCNDGFIIEFYKHFSNNIAPALLDVYDPRGKLDTMDFISRKEIMLVIYNKVDKKEDWWLPTTDPYTTMPQNRLKKKKIIPVTCY